jgi:phosphohistidine phosphatase
MNLFLARHGQAATLEAGKSMHLTAEGREEVAKVAQELLRRKLNLQQIWYSPKTRAAQTAEIYARVLGIPPANLIENKALSIDADMDLVYPEILACGLENLMVVSHEPNLEELSSLLVSGSDHLPQFIFPTAGVAAFEQGPNWRWAWLLEPSSL